jgi:hypothetical protein
VGAVRRATIRRAKAGRTLFGHFTLGQEVVNKKKSLRDESRAINTKLNPTNTQEKATS